MNAIHTSLARRGILRTQEDRLVGGVCSGLARRFGVDPWAVRALFALSLVAIPGSPVVVYPVLWILMPQSAGAVTVRGTKGSTV